MSENLRIPVFTEEEDGYEIRFFLELEKNENVLFTHSLYKPTELPVSFFGPKTTQIEQFEKEHSDAEPCPNCGFRFYVCGSIRVAYEGGGACWVCNGDPDFPHRASEFNERGEEDGN